MTTDLVLISRFLDDYENVALSLIEDFSVNEIALLVQELNPMHSIIIISHLAPYTGARVMEKVTADKAVHIVERMSTKKAEPILRQMEQHTREQILEKLTDDKATYFRRAFKYAKDQVGSHLEPSILTLAQGMNAGRALSMIRSYEAPVKPLVFILDSERKPVAYVNLNELVAASPEKSIDSIAQGVSQVVLADMYVRDVLDQWEDDMSELPVVNTEGQFVGTVSKAALRESIQPKIAFDSSALKAGNALGNLYLIGLTSLLGSSSDS